MKKTRALTVFKNQLGQANHFLVTTLVAFHDLDEGDRELAPESLRAAWNPKNKSRSITRSRNFVQQAFLAKTVDAIDTYFTNLYRKPNYLRQDNIESELDGAERMIYRKFGTYNKHFDISATSKALVEVLIVWRNNVIHSLANNIVSDDTKEVLLENREKIKSQYRGLIIDELASKAERGADLSFKETASLINAAHSYIRELDKDVINNLDLENLVIDLLKRKLTSKNTSDKFISKYYSLDNERKISFISNWLVNKHGILGISDSILEKSITIEMKRHDG